MTKKIAVGGEDFITLRKADSYYVATMLIRPNCCMNLLRKAITALPCSLVPADLERLLL